jgi:chorismate mutase
MGKLAELRARIDAMDAGIVDAMADRARYRQNPGFYRSKPQKELLGMGYDAIWLPLVYLPIMEAVCWPGDDPSEWDSLREPDLALQQRVYGRIMIGNEVMVAKELRGLAMENKPREAQVLAAARNNAAARNLDPSAVEGCFRLIIERTKDVERACRQSLNLKPVVIESCRTSCEDMKPVLRSMLVQRAMTLLGVENFDAQDRYGVAFRQEKGSGSMPVYVADLVDTEA